MSEASPRSVTLKAPSSPPHPSPAVLAGSSAQPFTSLQIGISSLSHTPAHEHWAAPNRILEACSLIKSTHLLLVTK